MYLNLMHSRKSLTWPSHGMDCSNGTRCLNFLTFIHQMSQIDDTWKFWAQFVFSDCYCYVGLYLAIRVAIGSCVYQSWSRWHHSLQPLIGTHIWKNNSSTSCWSSAIPIRNFKVPWNRWVYCEHKRAKVALSSIWWCTWNVHKQRPQNGCCASYKNLPPEDHTFLYPIYQLQHYFR